MKTKSAIQVLNAVRVQNGEGSKYVGYAHGHRFTFLASNGLVSGVFVARPGEADDDHAGFAGTYFRSISLALATAASW